MTIERTLPETGFCEALLDALFFDSRERLVAVDNDFRTRTFSPGAAALLGGALRKGARLQGFLADASDWARISEALGKQGSISGFACGVLDCGKRVVRAALDVRPLPLRAGASAGYLVRICPGEPPSGGPASLGNYDLALMRMNRLASIGQITAAFVHGIKTPLHVIGSMSEFVLESRLEPQTREAIQMIACNAHKTYQTVETVLAYSKDVNTRFERVSLAPVIGSICDLLSGNFNSRQVELARELGPAPEIMADANQVREALCNILLNSLDATPAGGRVAVRISLDEGDGAVCVQVSDTGPGIPREACGRLFEPFFTTKEKGTGLGLYLASQIMKSHGGRISAGNGANGGAVVRLVFPTAR